MELLEIKKEKLLLEFINNVVFEGFSISALRSASLQIFEDINYHLVLFPGGLAEIAEYYEQYSLARLMKQLEEATEIKGITKKIETALVYKIIKSNFAKEFLAELAKFYLRPQNTPIAIKAAWNVSDAIWQFAGDKSTNYNYYTKRGLLFSVYNASILYYLQDNSDDHIQTEEFITNSLVKVASIGLVKAKIKSLLPKIENIPIVRMFL
jgi:ubiquinone biosynthesis protein COQ9